MQRCEYDRIRRRAGRASLVEPVPPFGERILLQLFNIT